MHTSDSFCNKTCCTSSNKEAQPNNPTQPSHDQPALPSRYFWPDHPPPVAIIASNLPTELTDYWVVVVGMVGTHLSALGSRRVLHDIVDDMGESNQRVGPQQREAKSCILTLSQYDHQLFLTSSHGMAVLLLLYAVVVVALLVVVSMTNSQQHQHQQEQERQLIEHRSSSSSSSWSSA